MTKTDAEQHALVWELAAKLINTQLKPAMDANSTELVAARLAVSDLAMAMFHSYETMAKAIHD